MFLVSVLCYLFSIFISLYFNNLFYVFLIFLFLGTFLLILFIKKYSHFRSIIILYSFALLGYLVVFYQTYFFDSKLLNQDIVYQKMYATVYNVEKSYYYNISKIYVTDIHVPTKKKNLVLPNQAKLQYKGTYDIKVGDIIYFTGSLHPISHQVKPYGFDVYNSFLYNKIGATGFINNNVELIDNIKNYNLIDNFFNHIEVFKNFLGNQIRDLLQNDRLSTFLIAITLGSYTSPPKEDMINLQNSSLAHLISISGYHISLISLILFFSFRKILSLNKGISLKFNNKKIAAFLTMIVIIGYAFIVGYNTPALRAVIADVMICLSVILGFRVISLNTLFLAAFILIFYNIYIIYSASFLLSFFATLAIILFMQSPLAYKKIQYLNHKGFWYKTIFTILFSMLLTAIVEITIAPILAFYFSSISLVGMISNLICEPVFSFLVMPFMILYYITPSFIAVYFLKVASYGMEFILYIAKITSNHEYSILYVPFYPNYALNITLIAIVLFAVFYKYKFKYIFICIIALTQTHYLLFTKTPDIILSPNFSTIAFYKNNIVTYYKKPNQFLHNNWFSNAVKFMSSKADSDFICKNESCIVNIKNNVITISKYYEDFYEDCNNANLILFMGHAPKRCPSSTIIDDSLIKDHYAYIYINNNNFYIKYIKK